MKYRTLALCAVLFTLGLSGVFTESNSAGAVFAQTPSPTPTPTPSVSPSPSPSVTPAPSPSPDTSSAQKDEERLKEILAQEEKAKEELARLEGEERSLKQQIELADAHIQLTNLKIDEAKRRIEKAQRDLADLMEQIEELSVRIDRIQSTVDNLSTVLMDRIRETYMRNRISPVELFFSSRGFDEFLARYQYLRIIQLSDRRLLSQMQATKANYSDHKDLLKDKHAHVEAAKRRVDEEKVNREAQQVTLAKQKSDKQALLKLTQNDEERYRKIIVLLEGEARQLAKITVIDGKVTYSIEVESLKEQGQVTAGGTVGKMGNTGAPGCSSGPHLHFETITQAKLSGNKLEGTLEDPSTRLSPRTLYFWTDNRLPEQRAVGTGSWDWPLVKPQITQGFGTTKWSSRYANNFHTAVDMAPEEYPGGEWTVRAVSSGTMYSGVLKYNGCSSINVRFVDHGEGVFSLYWHLQ